MIESFAVVWGTLLLAPPIAAAVIHATRKRQRLLRFTLIVPAVVVVFLLSAAFAGLDFISGGANVAAFSIAYGAYCVLVFGAGLIGRPLIRWPVQLIACLPIVVGYVAATIGWLGLGFIVDDTVQPPEHTEKARGLVCQIEGWGGAVGDSGYTISIYRYWRPLPIRHRLVNLQVDESAGDRDASCADGFKAASR